MNLERVLVRELIIQAIEAELMVIGGSSSFNVLNENGVLLGVNVVGEVEQDVGYIG